MRFLLALVVMAGCGNKSKLDTDRGATVDALWDLAPDGTEFGVVASPRAVGLAFRGIAALRELTAQPDLAAAKEQLDMLAQGMFGGEGAPPEEAGFAADRAFAMFATTDGVLGIMPVGDRDKFMTAKGGSRGSAEDTLDGNTCREIDRRYVCATKPEMFARLGKGSLRGKVAAAGVRGDAELFMTGVTLLGPSKGELAIAALLERGELSVRGRWTGTPSGPLEKLAGVTAPHPPTTGASGFLSFHAGPLLASVPSVPIAGGVSSDQLAASLAGPISVVIPSGSIDIQLSAPLKDTKHATTIVEHCNDVGALFKLAATQSPGACRIVLQGTNALELDIWVDGNTLRVGAKKGPLPIGKVGSLTTIGRELAATDWTAALWGRGTMLNLTGIQPSTEEVPDQVALGIHAMALVNELGAAAKMEATGVSFRGYLRTAWANPDDVVSRYIAISGNEIVTGKATETAKAIADSAPTSPFAADFAAGQGGLMIPAAAIGIATSVILPAIARYIGGGGDAADAQTPTGPPMDDKDLAQLLVRAYVEEAYPQWKAKNPGKNCPAALDELSALFGGDPGVPVLNDPWGHPLVMQCNDSGFSVLSVGEDGKQGTADDLRAP